MRTRPAIAIVAAAVTVIGACSAVAVMALHPSARQGASAGTTAGNAPGTGLPDSIAGAVTRWHYTANGNFSATGHYLPGAIGFNLADVGSVAQLDRLPAGVLGLVWVGYCGGDTSTFEAMLSPMIGNPKLFGFYMADDPNPSTCTPAHLWAECEWVHAHLPAAKTFAILENDGSPAAPTFANSYTPRNSGLDLVGLDPYPVRSDLPSPDYGEIPAYIRAAEAAGWARASLVPVFQAFGGGRWGGDVTWTLPTPGEERQLLATWATVLPAAAFDYAYSWGQQNGDTSLSMSPGLEQVFAAHNA